MSLPCWPLETALFAPAQLVQRCMVGGCCWCVRADGGTFHLHVLIIVSQINHLPLLFARSPRADSPVAWLPWQEHGPEAGAPSRRFPPLPQTGTFLFPPRFLAPSLCHPFSKEPLSPFSPHLHQFSRSSHPPGSGGVGACAPPPLLSTRPPSLFLPFLGSRCAAFHVRSRVAVK